jgi:hypothetical protein
MATTYIQTDKLFRFWYTVSDFQVTRSKRGLAGETQMTPAAGTGADYLIFGTAQVVEECDQFQV